MPPAHASNTGGSDTPGLNPGLTPELIARLDRLAFRSRRNVVGSGAGQRLSPRPGTSAEFSDFRTYVAGDDYRRLDWNAYARLDRLLLRLYLGEEDLSVHLFVDVSASMRYGRPPKDAAAVRIAGALAYVALAGLDRVSVTGFADRVTASTRPLRGRQSCPRLWSALAGLGSGTDTDFSCLQCGYRLGRIEPQHLAIVLHGLVVVLGRQGVVGAGQELEFGGLGLGAAETRDGRERQRENQTQVTW